MIRIHKKDTQRTPSSRCNTVPGTRSTRIHEFRIRIDRLYSQSRSSSFTSVFSPSLGAAAAAAEDVLRRFVTLAPKAWTPESRADSPTQFRGEDIVDNLNADTYPRASKASKVAAKYADRMCVQRTKHT